MSAAVLSIEERVKVVQLHAKFGNRAEVQRQWKHHFASLPPARSTITATVQRFEKTGSVLDGHRSGRRASANTSDNRDSLQDMVAQNPCQSQRQLSSRIAVSPASVNRMLKDCGLRPYHPRLVQQLSEDDDDRREEFAENFLDLLNSESLDLRDILWSDEAKFCLNGMVNRHNSVYYARENPRVTWEQAVNAPGVTVWAAISVSGGIVGPFFFDSAVTGASYLAVLQDWLLPQLESLPNFNRLVLQQDGAPPHYHRDVRAFLSAAFPDRWIGRRGPIEWPARSPDLTPPDFFLWGLLKHNVYGQRPTSVDQLKVAICDEVSRIPVDICDKVCMSVRGRCERLLELSGRQLDCYD